ncbi:hypothetical protein MMC19_005088 [Ptychographa xylographoides]|nr:hypothetical protein [Ptychographa xylographoides]
MTPSEFANEKEAEVESHEPKPFFRTYAALSVDITNWLSALPSTVRIPQISVDDTIDQSGVRSPASQQADYQPDAGATSKSEVIPVSVPSELAFEESPRQRIFEHRGFGIKGTQSMLSVFATLYDVDPAEVTLDLPPIRSAEHLSSISYRTLQKEQLPTTEAPNLGEGRKYSEQRAHHAMRQWIGALAQEPVQYHAHASIRPSNTMKLPALQGCGSYKPL